jgi:hypothetical protein
MDRMFETVLGGKFSCMSWTCFSEPDLEDFLNNLYNQSGGSGAGAGEGGYSDQRRNRRKNKRKK